MWYTGQRTSVYLDDALQSAVKASGIPLFELVRRGLAPNAQSAQVTNEPSVTAAPSPAFQQAGHAPG